jgi:hypothetical protein
MSKLLDSHPLLQTEPAKVVTFNLARPWRRVEGDIEHGQTVLQ